MIVHTDFPVAELSADHIHPRGAKQDNTHCPCFVSACCEIFHRPSLLDMGCAGGGLVRDFHDAGLLSVGLEGSDYPKRNMIGEWGVIPNLLFCCDITKPFTITATQGSDEPLKFDIVSAWEVMEHIHEGCLETVFNNVRKHLKPSGLFMASIATFEDSVDGVQWHVTVRSREWWTGLINSHGFDVIQSPIKTHCFPRGSGNPLALGDWSGDKFGFHVVARMSCDT